MHFRAVEPQAGVSIRTYVWRWEDELSYVYLFDFSEAQGTTSSCMYSFYVLSKADFESRPIVFSRAPRNDCEKASDVEPSSGMLFQPNGRENLRAKFAQSSCEKRCGVVEHPCGSNRA